MLCCVLILITFTKVVFGETVMLTPGEVRVVYFSAGGKDILGRSGLLSVRSDINISHSSEINISNIPSGTEILLHHYRRRRPERLLKESCNIYFYCDTN